MSEQPDPNKEVVDDKSIDIEQEVAKHAVESQSLRKPSLKTPLKRDHTFVPCLVASEGERRSQRASNPTNRVKTTRYHWWSFLPVTMFIQFTRAVNVFYFFNAFLQMIPAISTNNPLATIIPLSFVIVVGIIKELVVEIKRWMDDRETNSIRFKAQTTPKGKNGGSADEELDYNFSDVFLSDIQVGDILEIRDNQTIPADCILLKATDPNGQVYVETAALDGERNLKPLFAPAEINLNYSEIFGLRTGKPQTVKVETISPLKDLYTFDGRIKIKAGEGAEEQIVPLTKNQFLHKGATLKDSDRVLGLVVYTGSDTKVALNLCKYRFKMSRLEKVTNVIIFINIAL